MGAVPAVAEVLIGTPRAGGPEHVAAAARYVDGVWLGVVDFSGSVRAAASALTDLEGAAVAALGAKLETGLVRGAAAVEQCAMWAKGALRAYGSEVDRVDREAAALTARVSGWLSSVRDAQRAIAAICDAIQAGHAYPWNAPPVATLPEPRLPPAAAGLEAPEREAQLHLLRELYRARWQHAALTWRDDLDAIRAAGARWESLIEDRVRAERRLVSSLEDTPIGQLASLGRGAVGGQSKAIALGLTGEVRGSAPRVASPGWRHRLLEPLLGTSDGSGIAASPPPAPRVAAWWRGLSPEEREDLIGLAPVAVGNLPGLLPTVWDRANRLAIAQFRANPQALDPEQLRLVAAIQRVCDTASAQRLARPPVQVLALDLSGRVPKAAIGYGNLDTSSHTSWYVPGMNSDAPRALPHWDVASRNLLHLQSSLLRRSGGGSAGVISWLGYETPKPLPSDEVLHSDRAAEGAARLAAELDGMYVARVGTDGGPPTSSVVAHSYGTAVAALALTLTAYPIDALVLLGSAGIDTARVPSLGRLRVRDAAPGQPAIYATNAPADRLAPSGAALAQRALPTSQGKPLLGLPRTPPPYSGVIEFPSAGDPARGLSATDGHSILGDGPRPQALGTTASAGRGYGDPDTQALHTTARITTQAIDRATANTFRVTPLAQQPEPVADPGARTARSHTPHPKEATQ